MEAPGTVTAEGNETSVTGGESTVPRPAFIPEGVPQWLLELAAAIVVIILAWLVANLLVRLFSRRLARHLQRPSLTRVSLAGIRVGVYIFAFLTILRIFGLDLGSIALSVTVFSAVVGIILAPIVGSIISGMFLLADQPYEIGDLIELEDREVRGYVEDITLRYTKVFTLDNTFLVVPNGEMRTRDVVNYSAEDTRVRLSLGLLITYETDLARARDRVEASARCIEGVISGGPRIRIGSARYPAGPTCLVEEFADHGIELQLRFWVQEPYRIQTIRSDVQANIYAEFAEENIEFAYHHSHLVFDDTSGVLEVRHAEDEAVLEAEEGPEALTDDTGASDGPDPS